MRVPIPEGERVTTDVVSGSTTGTIVRVHAAGAQLAFVAFETFRTAPMQRNLAEALASLQVIDLPPNAWVGPMGDSGVLAIEPDTPPLDGFVSLASALIPGPDGLLVFVHAGADAASAATGGCQKLAVRLLEEAHPGHRRLFVQEGDRRLLGDMGLTLPEAHHVSMLRAVSYLRLQVSPIARLGEAPSFMEITVGEPRRTRSLAPDDAEVFEAVLLERVVEWRTWDDGRIHYEGRLDEPDGSLRILVTASSRLAANELLTVATTLRTGVSWIGHPCRSTEAPPWWDVAPEPPEELRADYTTLRDAGAFAFASGFTPTPQLASFERLARSPDGALAFRRLARNGTAVGRLYGLAGIYLSDPADFAAALCATRSTLPRTIDVQGLCAVSELLTTSLIESTDPGAIRGEIHWDPVTWSMASGSGVPDLVGGGLSHVMLHRGPVGVDGWAVQGDGFAHLTGDALPLVALAAPRPHRLDLRVLGDQMCATRRDGRVVCFGGRESENALPWVLPDVVRHPRAVIRPNGATCALDEEGQRVCFGRLLDAPSRHHADACSVRFDESAISVRRFTDGPFSALFDSDDGCGLTETGRLRCFVLQRNRMPEWVDAETVTGFGASYEVPVEGLVGAHGGFAWTASGEVYEVGRHQSPAPIGAVPGHIRSVAGQRFGPAFFTLADGRVFVYRASHAEDGSLHYWQSARHDDPGPAFSEIAALAGADVSWSGQHGCARYRDGRVSCFGWNQNHAIGPGAPDNRSPRDVPAFRGARAIFPAQRYTCALLSGGRLRCYGEFSGAVDPGSRTRPDGSQDLNVGRVLAHARER